jgi:PAS domain S-box-containing protein
MELGQAIHELKASADHGLLDSRVSMERYRLLVESSPDGILLLESGRIAFANRAAADLFGVAGPEALLGRSLSESVEPDSRASLAAYLSQQQPDRAATLEAKLLLSDGVGRDISITGVRLATQEPDAIQLAVRDVTDSKAAERTLRESEERLTLAVAGGLVGVWDWDLETNAVVYSPRWKEMLGYGIDEIEPNLSAWERLVHPDDRARADEANDSVAQGSRTTYEAEFRLRHKDGHYVHVLSRGFPVRRKPGGPVVRIVGTHFDLTERKQAEAERTRTEFLSRLVFAQEDERRRIAREMHDQFGENLTALTLRIRMLKDAICHTDDWRAHGEALEAILQRLDRDVDHLVWELRPTALDDLGLRAALSNYVQVWSKRVNIQAALHTSGLLDHRLSADVETALYRVAQEALTNVAKHARASKVDIILERRADHVLLIIEDDGVGFEPATTGGGGQTFGLLGMKERAALVGAKLEIETSTGQGTTVLVRVATVPAAGPTSNHA